MTRRTIGADERRARLARRHHLALGSRLDDAVAVADDLVALHATDPVTPHLSVAARAVHPSLSALAAALYDDRSVIRHHAMRRTLWVMTPAVARLAHGSCTAKLAEQETRRLVAMLESNGVKNAERWMKDARAAILDVLPTIEPATARQVGDALPALKVPLRLAAGKSYASTQQAHTRVLLVLGFEGAVVRARPTGTWINGQYRWATMESWLPGGVVGLEPRQSAAGLAAHWLRAFGPATATDLQWWTGWTAAATKRALADARAVEVDLDGVPGWVASDDLAAEEPPAPWVALLPALDPTTMGWKLRDWYLDPAHAALLFDRNGNAGPTVWADGRIVGGWVQRADGEIAVRVLADVGTEHELAIGRAAEELAGLLGDTRFSHRFPAPLRAQLR